MRSFLACLKHGKKLEHEETSKASTKQTPWEQEHGCLLTTPSEALG